MPKLNQVNALVSGRKSEAQKRVSEIYKKVQSDKGFDGFSRVYSPLDEDNGERLPSESQKVQTNVMDCVNEARETWKELWDLVATQDEGNTKARADVIVEGGVVLKQVPVTTLLFLEKQLNDLETFISKLPTPELTEDWDFDSSSNLLKSKPSQSIKTKKMVDFKVIVPPTKEHPAQVVQQVDDVKVGTWTRVNLTGRIQSSDKAGYLSRVKRLRDAVKVAREQANMVDAEKVKVSDSVFGFVFG